MALFGYRPPWYLMLTQMVLAVVLLTLAVMRGCDHAHAQDVSSVDVVTMAAVASSIDGPDAKAKPLEKSPDYVGVDLLAYWSGDKSPNVTRFHDRQSGVEFICIRDRGCVLTGRKW